MSWPCATKSLERASSSLSFDGGLATEKLSTGSTSPIPKYTAQTRLTKLRAKYGFSGRVIQAKSRRRGSPSSGSSGPPNARGGSARPVAGSVRPRADPSAR